GKLALEYFHHRGFADETIRKFGLGYSMNSWDDLLKHAQAKDIDTTILEKAGLVIRREDNSGLYDRFRGRAMFPIFSPSGRPIGFGARKMREDDPVPGKYINSPETPVYFKSQNLYGLFHAKEAIREKENAILVEGYADLISVFQAGIENIIASSGTALTEEQILLIGRYAKNITLVYDADSAGSKATMRGVDMIIENGLEVKVAELPAGEDPDSFVRKHGGKEFWKLLSNAVSFIDFKTNLFQSQGQLQTPEGLTRAVNSIVGTIAKIPDEVGREFYINQLWHKYGIREPVLYRALEKRLGPEARQLKRTQINKASSAGRSTDNQAQLPVNDVVTEARSVPETDLIKAMVGGGVEIVEFVFTYIDLEMFTNYHVKEIARIILERAVTRKDLNVSALFDEIADEATGKALADILTMKHDFTKRWNEVSPALVLADPWQLAEPSVRLLRKRKLLRVLEEIQRRMNEAKDRGEAVLEYMEQHQTLLKEMRDLESIGSSGKKSLA
ncbi:MAG: primase, partial [Bacteroidetes bacterium]|nr:primase [Bacteroidota bacterium]